MTESSVSTINTLNREIIDLAAKKDLSISRLCRIINRTLPPQSYQHKPALERKGLRGRFISHNNGFSNFFNLGCELNIGDKTLIYKHLTMPGEEGFKILEELDEFFEKMEVENLTTQEISELIAFILICIGSAHAFSDGNGRVGIGVVDILFRKLLNRKINQESLSRSNNQLTTLMAIGSILLLPENFNPNNIQGAGYIIINIPTTKTHNNNEIQEFAVNYSQNIIKEIKRYNPRDKNPSSNLCNLKEIAIMPLANLLFQNTIETAN